MSRQGKDIFDVFHDLEHLLKTKPELLRQPEQVAEPNRPEKKKPKSKSSNTRKKSVTSSHHKAKQDHEKATSKKKQIIDHPRKTAPQILRRQSEPPVPSKNNTIKLQLCFMRWTKKLLEKLMAEDINSSEIDLEETSPIPGDPKSISSTECVYPNSFDIQDTPDMCGARTSHCREKPQGETVVRDFATGTKRRSSRNRR